jgi:hypothetical protein
VGLVVERRLACGAGSQCDSLGIHAPEHDTVTEIVHGLALAWFLGAAGLVGGVVAGLRSKGVAQGVWSVGAVVGVALGCVLSAEFVREVADSSSSTASLGLLLVPFPPITNGITGAVVSRMARSWKDKRAASEAR